MDTNTLIKALKVAVREVVKEELTEILREGLQSTLVEMKQPVNKTKIISQKPQQQPAKKKPLFEDNKWANILNDTDALVENQPLVMNSYKDAMNESMQEIKMTSRDAQSFGMSRQNMQQAMGLTPSAPQTMEDPEDGRSYEVAPEVQQALTRDYSALMKAIDAKKGR
jgi:hypothetical protein